MIRRFITPAARFPYVAPAEGPAVARWFNAIALGIKGVAFSHRAGRCSLDALPDDVRLHIGALDRRAAMIRGANTDRHDLAPQAAGLFALSVGVSRMFRDDLQRLEAGMALYRWARDGHEEGHDWPQGGKA